MADNIIIVYFTGESTPHFVYDTTGDEALSFIKEKGKEVEILGKMKIKDYMKNEKQIQELYKQKVRNKKK
jgi:hypothetical protein